MISTNSILSFQIFKRLGFLLILLHFYIIIYNGVQRNFKEDPAFRNLFNELRDYMTDQINNNDDAIQGETQLLRGDQTRDMTSIQEEIKNDHMMNFEALREAINKVHILPINADAPPVQLVQHRRDITEPSNAKKLNVTESFEQRLNITTAVANGHTNFCTGLFANVRKISRRKRWCKPIPDV